MAPLDQGIREMLTAVGIEPFPFHRIRIGTAEFADVRLGGLGGGQDFRVRFGQTSPLENPGGCLYWRRRSVAEFIGDGHALSDATLEAIEKFQVVRLPIGCSIMVWTLGIGMGGPMARDHLLVLECGFEFDRHVCIALCRWNG